MTTNILVDLFAMKSAAFICTSFMLCRIKSKLVEHQSNLSSCSSLPVRVKIKWKGRIQVWPHFVVAFCSRCLVSCECQQHLRHLTYVCIRVHIDKFCPEENLGEYEYFFVLLFWQEKSKQWIQNISCRMTVVAAAKTFICLKWVVSGVNTHTQQKCCSWLLSQCSMVYWLHFWLHAGIIKQRNHVFLSFKFTNSQSLVLQ